MVSQPGNYRIEVAPAMSKALRVPSLRHHRPSGRAVVTLDGKDYYLGRYGSQESKAEYQRLLAVFLAGGLQAGSVPSDLTVNELAARSLKFADGYYAKNNTPTAEPRKISLANRPLRQLYGHTPAA